MNSQYHIFDRTRELKRQQQKKDTDMEVVDSVCEAMCDVLPSRPEHVEHMETHVSEEEASAPAERYTDRSDPGQDDGRPNAAASKPCYSYR